MILGFFALGIIGTALTPHSNTSTSTTGTNSTNPAPAKTEKSPSEKNDNAIKNMDFNYHWRKGGFDNVFILSMKIKNKNTVAVKDLTIDCEVSSNSGTHIGSIEKDLLEKIEAGKTLSVNEFNMGIINSQASKANCVILTLKTKEYLESLGLNF